MRIDWLLWAPLATASIHVFEEFVWPDGFRSWYLRYRAYSKTVSTRFLFFINAGLLVTCFEGALAGRSAGGAVFLLALSAVLFSNGCWHLWASYQTHSYSPGAISGLFLYLPLGFYEYSRWLNLGKASIGLELITALIGGSYPFWSARYHRKSAPAKQ